ncbi:MAG: DUF192 domain-containing protein [Planctomycetaceae bacterium]
MTGPRLINCSTGCIVVERLAFAATFWTRFRGLQFRKSLPPDQGLLIAPCRSIHTHWMRFTIDVVMINHDGIVVVYHPSVRPWRMLAGDRSVAYVLETNAGGASCSVGDQLQIEAIDDAGQVPQQLRHLLNKESMQGVA